jgi:hypothetical protein
MYADHVTAIRGSGSDQRGTGECGRQWRAAPGSVGTSLVEAHDEWQTGDRRYLAEGAMALLTAPPAGTTAELVAA